MDKSIVLRYNGNQAVPILSFIVRKLNNQMEIAESTHNDSCITFSFDGALEPELSLEFDCSQLG